MKNSKMDKASAILEIVYDAENNRYSTASAKRVVAAMRFLKCSPLEIVQVMYHLGYCNDVGAPYDWGNRSITPVWFKKEKGKANG